MTKIADLIADNSQEISRLGTRHTNAVRERPEGGQPASEGVNREGSSGRLTACLHHRI